MSAAGVPFTLPIDTTDPGPDTISAIKIEWGDGSSSTIAGDSGSPTHVYAADGHYTIRATTTDEDGSTWAEHEIDIGDNNPPPIDDGYPVIVSATAVILASGNAQLTVEAENSAGTDNDLTYEWDLDGDGLYETPGGPSVEIPPSNDAYPYSARVRISDSQGRSGENLFGFTADGPVMPGPATAAEGIRQFKNQTPGLPPETHFHHTKQKALAARYWKERQINVFDPQYVRAIPEKYVHTDHINSQQMQWWRKKATDLGYGGSNWSAVFNDTRVTWAEIDDMEAKLNGQFNKYWVPVKANKTVIDNAANMAKRDKVILQVTKASRWKQIGIISGTALPVFTLVTGKIKAFENMQNFDPETHATFGVFRDKYEDCLVQAMMTGDRPPEIPVQQLVDTMFDFALDIARDANGNLDPKDAEALALGRQMLHTAVTKHYN